MPFETIKAPNLSEAASAQIRKLIADDVLRPGDQLPGERDLSARMGISRTSLRAALQTLVTEGLLVSRHGSGLWVSREIGRALTDPLLALIETSDKAAYDYIHFRIMLESDCAALVAERATPEERAHIDRINTAMQDAFQTGAPQERLDLDTEFHMAIVEATGNVITTQIARSLHALLQTVIRDNHRAAYETHADQIALAAQHEAINRAIQSGDPDGARSAMRDHLLHFEALMRKKADTARRGDVIEKRRQWAENTTKAP